MRRIDPEKDYAAARVPLQKLSKELLRLHKLLLDLTREEYEREHGRVENSFKFLELVLHDPYFGWLRRLSELIVQIDEMLDHELVADRVVAILHEVEQLVLSDGSESDFNQHFQAMKQREVNVLMQQNAVRGALGAVPSGAAN